MVNHVSNNTIMQQPVRRAVAQLTLIRTRGTTKHTMGWGMKTIANQDAHAVGSHGQRHNEDNEQDARLQLVDLRWPPKFRAWAL